MKNVGTAERVARVLLGHVARVLLGGALAIWMFVRLFDGDGLILILLDIALIALGVDFVITGLRGYYPLYKHLGWTTAKSAQT